MKDKQLTELEDKLQLMEEGNTASLVAEDTSTTEPSESVLNAVEQLTKINKQIVALKE